MSVDETAYERGVAAGEIAARLANHDRHFAAINGSLADLAHEMHDLTLAVQRLGDQAAASATTVVATAAALANAEKARREQSTRSWTPFQRLLAVLGVGVALAGLAYAVLK